MTNQQVYIIAEVGVNHNGSINNCVKLIDDAAKAGCNAVKFQLFKAADLYPKSAGSLDWQDGRKKYSYDIFQAVKSLEFQENWLETLLSVCAKKQIDLLFSVFNKKGVDLLLKSNMRKIKLSSYTLTHLPLIECCAKTSIPIIMSTGGGTLGEVEDAIQTVSRYHKNLAILHCSIGYPTDLEDCNLGVIETLQKAFPGIAVGWSDHTIEVADSARQAVYLGATVIEKHITLDRGMDGPDHFFALEPTQLRTMVKEIRQAEIDRDHNNYQIDSLVYGSTAKVTYAHEAYLRKFAFMKLFTNRAIKKGEFIGTEDISILRPGKKRSGLDPKYITLFTDYRITAKRDIDPESPIDWDLILS